MVRISTLFVPYKIILHEDKPVRLEITVKNTANEPKLMSVVVELPYELSLNRGGFLRRGEQRIGEIKPGETHKVVFEIYARPTTEPGTYPVSVKVVEHMDSYQYVAREYKKDLTVKVVQ